MKTDPSSRQGFTLIELMVVIGIMGLIFGMGAPPLTRIWKKEGMRKALSDVAEICSNARAQAILRGTEMDVVFHPLERRLEVAGSSASAPPPPPAEGNIEAEQPPPPPKPGQAAQLPADINIEMLDINFLEYNQSDAARVRFFPNGTSDDMTLILHSSKKNEWWKISLEVTTALATVENVR
jgi:prepilin-type N-terminal cleavage/methylation domain-containing protein